MPDVTDDLNLINDDFVFLMLKIGEVNKLLLWEVRRLT